ncbi:hypothetical protein IW262DRAFT_1462228 [Armillaria fumosa]|nr:hypothetical protein IW262DRAFT_1462228 [Armillaria fumosa]
MSPAATPRARPRNLTVTGDEHLGIEHPLKHKQRFDALVPNVPKELEADTQAISGKDRSTTKSCKISPMPLLLTPPPTPSPQTQHHPDTSPNIRARLTAPKHFPSTSTIPKRMRSSPLLTLEDKSTEQDRPAPARWRGVVVEEEDDERSEIPFRYLSLPPNPPELTPSKRDTFPGSSYLTPSKDRVWSEDDEEMVLYPTGISRLRSPYDSGYGREVSCIAPRNLEIRWPIDDDDIDGEKDNEISIEDRAPSSTSVSYLQQDALDSFPPAGSNSRHNVAVESEMASDVTSFQTPLLLPPAPVLSAFLVGGGDTTSTNTLEKTTSSVSSCSSSHSRTNSFGPQEAPDCTDPSISRECGVSLDIARTDKRDGSTVVTGQSEISQSSSTSISVSALTPPSVSPGPLIPGVDSP